MNFLKSLKFSFLGIRIDYPIAIQWHITTKCQNKCKHCYMYEPQILQREQERTLNLQQKIDILNQLDNFGKKYGFCFNHFVLIGGDPLLADDIFNFIKELKKRGKTIAFAGNPETLTDENCKKLKKYGVISFQLSLDGLEKTHDLIRGEGSFKRTIAGYEQLDKYGIHAITMITLSDLNINDFFELIDYVFYKTKSKGVSFDFCVHIGNAKKIKSTITPELVLDISNKYLDIKELRRKERSNFHFAEKSGFLKLLRMQRKEILFIESETTDFIAGCLIGCKSQCILSDGTLPLCRRLPKVLGRLPEDDFEEIFLSNEMIKKYRRPQYFEDCGNCIGWNWCRGCPAISEGEFGNPFSKPNICFSHLLDLETYNKHESISMQTTSQEEVELIKRNTHQNYFRKLYERKFSFRVLKMFKKLKDHNEAKSFSDNPEKWFLKNASKLNCSEKAFVLFHYNRKALGFMCNKSKGD